MSSPDYKPAPVDSSRIKLTEDILMLMENLASNTHETWSRERIAQGWKYGTQRNDEKKEHPCLIPYHELSEEEKKIDRSTAMETIKAILTLGFQVQAPEGQSISAKNDASALIKETMAQIRNNPKLTVADLRQIWENHAPSIWSQSVDLYRRSVDTALRMGEAFMAYDIAAEGLQTYRGDLRLTQLQALALARTGATRRANEILDHLRARGHQDEETLGLLARTHKDFWQISADPEERRKSLKISFELYFDSYKKNGGYYSGINAASMGLIYGEKEAAQRTAREVFDLCLSTLDQLSPESEERYWLEATLGEAAVILGNMSQAEDHYVKASKLGRGQMIVLSRTRSQARLLLEHITGNVNGLDHCFRLPKIVVFSGHMFDRADRRNPRFPITTQDIVRAEIRRRLDKHDAAFGFSSGACGGDLLFAEGLLDRGGEINIALPFRKDEFRKSSVDILPGTDFGDRFEHILARAATVTVLNEWGSANDGAAFDYCNQALNGLALLKGKFFGMDVVPLAVWDGKQGDGRGGTQTFVEFWQEHHGNVDVINLSEILHEQITLTTPTGGTSHHTQTFTQDKRLAQEIKAMLFADIVGFTKLTEMQVPHFVEHFMGKVAELMQAMSNPPIHKNTWGDAVCCVFDHVRDAGIFALNLRDMVRGTNWNQWGLPNDLNIRIALHAGPVYACYDPVLGKMTYNGSHVNRTARIEPVAEEGQVYASQAFAALATAEGVAEFMCDYVGTKQLAKKYGAIPVFLVRPTAV